jgi:hypothetical protein
MGPSVSAHRGHDPPGTVTDARLVRAPGRAAGWRAGNPSRGLPGHRNDVVHTPLRHATTSGGACVDRLWTLEPEAVTRHLTHCGRHESRCLLVIIDGGITSPVRQCLSAGSLEATEETFGWPIPASRAMAASATGHGRRASVGLTTDARWWWRRRGAGGAGALASRSAGQRLHAPIEPRPAAGASTRPPRSPPPRRAGWLPMRCWSPRHSPPSQMLRPRPSQ